MPNILIRHKVQDYIKWRSIYDEHGATRKDAGCEGTHVFRNSADPNEVIVMLRWDTLENARRFADSANLGETMERAGVTDQPDIFFLDDAGRTSE